MNLPCNTEVKQHNQLHRTNLHIDIAVLGASMLTLGVYAARITGIL